MRTSSPWEDAVRRGDYRAAWAINDSVLAGRATPPDDPRLPYHLRYVWDGRPFDGRDVLVRCYHGLGDTLQFIRYLPALRARAASVTLEAQPELVSLLRGISGVDRLIPFDVARPAPQAGCDIEVMELSHALRLPPDAVPPPYLLFRNPPSPCGRGLGGGDVPRLTPPPNPLPQGEGGLFMVGHCTLAGDWDAGRSVPPDRLAAALPVGCRPIPLRGTTIADTAALILVADMVVSVDTMVAHLAGALGRQLCVLLKVDGDWRWGGGPSTPWYPRARLYRQRHPGDWSAPLAALARDLSRLSPPADGRAG